MLATIAIVSSTLVLGLVEPTSAAPAASYTGTNSAEDGTGHCGNGSGDNPVNCNTYDGKEFVWLNGGPVGEQLGNGEFFFAVLNPSGQQDPNDDTGTDILSTDDAETERTFTVQGGVVTYGGTHDWVGNQIRLVPYADTTNPGGVYILAICRIGDVGTAFGHVDPSACKYDAFKVQEGDEPVEVNAIFMGTKFLDLDGDGSFDAGEPGIEDWEINIYTVDNADVRTLLDTVSTDANGDYFFQSPSVDQGTDEHFVVCEVQQAGWAQTGPLADAFTLAAGSATGGAVVTSTDDANDDELCYDVTTDGDALATASLLDFWNIPDPTLSGAKYFDGDKNGQRGTEVGIEGWLIQILDDTDTVVCTVETDANGDWSSADCPLLIPGTYTVREVQATNTTIWQQTGNTTDQSEHTGTASVTLESSKEYTVIVPESSPSSVSKLYFGNVCNTIVTPGGHTMGFWSNKNGQALISQGDINALNAMFLRNGAGIDQSWAGSLAQQKTAYKNWLLAATATNMSYMLSAQLSATYLSVQHGITNGNAVVGMPGNPTATVLQVIDAAKTMIQTYPVILSGHAQRVQATALKDILDKINNNGSFANVASSPDDCDAPVFPA